MAWTRVARSDEVAEGRGLRVLIGDRPLAIFRAGGRLFCLKDICPHEADALSRGKVEEGCVVCPGHGWKFRLDTGACTDRPGQAVRSFPVKEESGQLFVEP